MRRMSITLGVLSIGCALLGATSQPARGDGSVTFGSLWFDQNHPESMYQTYNDVRRGPFIGSFALRERDDRNSFMLYGTHALRGDQSTKLTWSNGVRCRVDVGYSKIPHNLSFVSRTPYAENARGVYTLPDSLQNRIERNPTYFAATMKDFLANARKLDMSVATEVSRARIRARPARGWQFEATGTRRARTGYKPYGASLGFSLAIELPEPIDQRMLDGDVRASYYNDRLSLRLSGGVSAFTNNVGEMLWDNPKRLTDKTYAAAYSAGDGTSKGRLDLYPDNRAVRGSVDMGYQLPRRTMLSASVAVSQMTQNDDWLPMTINTAIPEAAAAVLPGTSTDGKATLLSGDCRLISHAIDKLTGTLRFQRSHYDNKTKEYTFPGYVRLDQVWEAEEIHAHPYGNERTTYGLDLNVDPVQKVTFGGTLEYLQRDRTYREVEKDNETVFAGQVRVRPADEMQIKARYRHGARELDHFELEEYEGLEQPGLRRYDVADRKQDKFDVGASWSPDEKGLFSVSYVNLKNDYDKSELGLLEDKQQMAMVDATVRPTGRLDLSGGLGWSEMKTNQRSTQSGGTLADPDTAFWAADIETQNVIAYADVELRSMRDKLTLVCGFEYNRTPTTFDLANAASNGIGHAVPAQDLPDTRYQRRDLLLGVHYRLSEDTELGLRYDFEKFDVKDFASEDIPLLFPVTGASNAVFLGAKIQDYDAHRFALMVKRDF